jgi:hypothetical protein
MNSWPEYSITNSIHKLFMKLGEKKIKRLFQEVAQQAIERGMIYEEEDGSTRPIHLMLRPRLISPQQRNYFIEACHHMNQAFLRLGELYLKSKLFQKLLPLSPEEHEWFLNFFPTNPRAPKTLITRWDANTNFSGQDWKASFHFLEVNGVGVGGLHYSPTAERIILEIVLNTLRQLDENLRVSLNDDIREVLLCEIQFHLKALGKRRCHIGLIQDNRFKGGPLDFFYLEKFYRSQGIKAVVIDPRELTLKKGEIMAEDLPLDILYRDSTLFELIDMEKEEKRPLKAVRKAFQENRVISGLGGELDHKSALEIFSNPQFEKYFTSDEKKFFKRHIPWTRLVCETRSPSPDGKLIDLVPYAISHREELVLKPNRGFGGTGILIGRWTSPKKWQDTLQQALKDPGSYVLQQKCAVRRKKFPALDRKGRVTERSLNVVCGFIYSHFGLGILGRASLGNVVNVAQQGGMTTIMICENRLCK